MYFKDYRTGLPTLLPAMEDGTNDEASSSSPSPSLNGMTSVLSLPPEPQPAFGSTSPPDEGVDGWVTDEDDSAPLAVTRGAVIVNCNNRDTKGAQRRAGSRFQSDILRRRE